jgi:SAM-dependent methyltransferase
MDHDLCPNTKVSFCHLIYGSAGSRHKSDRGRTCRPGDTTACPDSLPASVFDGIYGASRLPTLLAEGALHRWVARSAFPLMLLWSRRMTRLTLKRDYDAEFKDKADHRYAYNFDFDVMHKYMLRSFEPLFREGSLLELGSFKGDFTRRLLPRFTDITCVEASPVAIGEARASLPAHVHLINGLFETVQLPCRYDNILLTHVLEHLDDPVGVLRRVRDEWLTETGRLFLVCPNANAPSRQIAVKMGLIPHNAAITPAEEAHGHRITYSLDTLERDARSADLQIVHRSGIFFKALANFQWDRLLETDIVSAEYLDGCYMLGQQYPDLCASIFLVCEAGK